MKIIYQILIWIATFTLFFWFLAYNFWITDFVAALIMVYSTMFVVHRNYLITSKQ
jgi:cation transport ATPase